ncbi:E3 ubiquitin-protein ligase CCNB1IP1, partial [Exaiptasia diaphana]
AKSKGLEETKKRLTEISEKLEDKTRQYLKLQGMYDSLRRKAITPTLMLTGDEKRPIDSRAEQVRNSFLFSLDTGADLLRTSSSNSVNPAVIPVQAERDFALQQRGLPAQRPSSCAATPTCPTDHQIQKNFTVDFVSTPDLTRRLYRKK